MKRHHAGRDLTTDIQAAPHGTEVLERYPQVGILKEKAVEREIPEALSFLLSRFPFLRRHPHPMIIHFPIAFMFSTAVFNILYILSGNKAFETTALHCLAGGVLFTPLAIGTGFYTWWLNYMAKPTRAVAIKQRVSAVLFAVEIIVFVWRIEVPDILASFQFAGVIYFLLILSLFPMVTVIGWFGAKLTFPIEKE
jgi:uncharacterized membrane protein